MTAVAELRVRGSAQREVEPDYAIVQVTLSALDNDRSSALQAATAQLEGFRAATEGRDDIRASRLSSMRVTENYQWNPKTNTNEAKGWIASLHGTVEMDTAAAPAVLGRLTDTSAQIGYISWCLDPDNPAYREVRQESVADAVRAANDFAAALGRDLGDLRVLADAGLLGAEGSVGPVPMMARAMGADAGVGGPIDLDPAPQTVVATVEATFSLQ